MTMKRSFWTSIRHTTLEHVEDCIGIENVLLVNKPYVVQGEGKIYHSHPEIVSIGEYGGASSA